MVRGKIWLSQTKKFLHTNPANNPDMCHFSMKNLHLVWFQPNTGPASPQPGQLVFLIYVLGVKQEGQRDRPLTASQCSHLIKSLLGAAGPTWPEYVARHYDVNVYNYAVCSSVSGGTNTTQPALYYPCGLHPLGPPDGQNFIPAVDVLLRAMQDQNRATSSVPIPSMLQQINTYLQGRPTVEASAVHFIVRMPLPQPLRWV